MIAVNKINELNLINYKTISDLVAGGLVHVDYHQLVKLQKELDMKENRTDEESQKLRLVNSFVVSYSKYRNKLNNR